ncbi:hypothetical protein D3C81_942060 [compost metagenome]
MRIEEGQGGKGLVHDEHRPGITFQPALLPGAQGQLLAGNGVGCPGLPATLDLLASLGGNAVQCLVEDLQQPGVGRVQGKAESSAIELCKVQHLQIEPVFLANQVLGANGIPHKSIHTPKGDCLQRMAQGVEPYKFRMRVRAGELRIREIPLDGRNAFAGKEALADWIVALAANHDGLVDQVGLREHHPGQLPCGIGCAAEEVYFASMQGLDGAVLIGELPYLDLHVQVRFQYPQVVCGDPLQILSAGCDFERRVVRTSDSHDQGFLAVEPPSISFGQLQFELIIRGATQQL